MVEAHLTLEPCSPCRPQISKSMYGDAREMFTAPNIHTWGTIWPARAGKKPKLNA